MNITSSSAPQKQGIQVQWQVVQQEEKERVKLTFIILQSEESKTSNLANCKQSMRVASTGYSTPEGWEEFGGVRIACADRIYKEININEITPHLCIQVRTLTAQADQAGLETYNFHAVDSQTPVRIAPISKPPFVNCTEYIYLPKHLSDSFEYLFSIFNNALPRGAGCRFSYKQVILSYMKISFWTKQYEREIVANLFTMRLSERVNDKKKQVFCTMGLRTEQCKSQEVFCSSLAIRILQIAWLHHKIRSNTALKNSFETKIQKLVNFCQGDYVSEENTIQEIWKHTRELCKQSHLFNGLPDGLRFHSERTNLFSAMAHLRNGLNNKLGFKESIIGHLHALQHLGCYLGKPCIETFYGIVIDMVILVFRFLIAIASAFGYELQRRLLESLLSDYSGHILT